MNETNENIARSTLEILETAVQNVQNRDNIEIKLDPDKKEEFVRIFKDNEKK